MENNRVLYDLSDVQVGDWVLKTRYRSNPEMNWKDEEVKTPVQIAKIWKNGVIVADKTKFVPPYHCSTSTNLQWICKQRSSTLSPYYLEPFPAGREPAEWMEQAEKYRLLRKAEAEAKEAKVKAAKQERLNSIEGLESLDSYTTLPGGELYIVPDFTSDREDDIALLISSVVYEDDK